jgi:hypothetical protein
MLRREDLVRTDVSQGLSASIIRVTRISELGTLAQRSLRRLLVTASVVPSSPILVALMKEALSSSETSVLTRATRRNIPEDAILHTRNGLWRPIGFTHGGEDLSLAPRPRSTPQKPFYVCLW